MDYFRGGGGVLRQSSVVHYYLIDSTELVSLCTLDFK